MKVVLDTNVILSGLAYPASVPGKVMQAWRTGALDVYLSEYILLELRRVLPRLRHRHGLDDGEIDDLVDILAFQCELVTPVPVAGSVLRDASDNPVLGTYLAMASQHDGDYLISGDKDLLVLSTTYPVISPADFCARHGL